MLNNSTSQYFNARFCTVVVAENHSCNNIIDPLSLVRYNPCGCAKPVLWRPWNRRPTLLSWNMTPFYVGLYQLLSASIIFSSLAQSQNASQKLIRGLNLEIYIQFYKWINKQRLSLLNNWSKWIAIRYSWDNWSDFGHARSKYYSTISGQTLSPPELHGITNNNTIDNDQRTSVDIRT